MAEPIFLNRYISGLRSRSVVHLGTFFGNLKLALEAQEHSPQDNFMLIADHHALAGGVSNVQQENYTLLRKLLALGLDPTRTFVYRQSDVPELFECMWLLSCCTNTGELFALPDNDQVHEKEIASTLYPLLMAADILGIRASHVTVGADEGDHVQYAANVAKALRSRQVSLPIPARNPDARITVPGVDGARMAHSSKNYIGVFDSEATIKRRFNSIPSLGSRREPADPDSDTAFKLYAVLAQPEEVSELASAYRANHADDRDTKKELLKVFMRNFEEARVRHESQAVSDDLCEQIFAEGRQRVRSEFRVTMGQIRDSPASHG